MAPHEPSGDVPVDPRRPSGSRDNKLLIGVAILLVAFQAVRIAADGGVEVVVVVIAVVLALLLVVVLQWVRTSSSRRLVGRVQALRPDAEVLPCLLSSEGHAMLRTLGVPTTGLTGLGGSLVALVAGPPGVELWRKPKEPQRVLGLDWRQAGLARGTTAVGVRHPAALVLTVDGHRVPLPVTSGLGLRMPASDITDECGGGLHKARMNAGGVACTRRG